jgi:KaiC/GvpD/RAD55 family RecA-like ATPase
MAELAASASVAGLLSLTLTVVEVSHRYFANARNATRTVKRYFRELEALRFLLGDLKNLDINSFSMATTTALEGCYSELEQLRSKLQKRRTETAFSSAIHRLTWPFAEEETRNLIEVIHRYLNIFHAALSVDSIRLSASTLEAVRRVELRVIDVERQKILSWLSSVNPYSNHTSARDKHGASTGDWFIESGEFAQWRQEENKSLWLTGIPGAGKTVLCSTVIQFLQKNRKVFETVFIFYFDFSDDQKQTLQALLRSLIAQACELLDTIPSEVIDLFEKSRGYSPHRSLDYKVLLGLLKCVLATFESVNIVLDALDESSELSNVLGFLHDLKSSDFENVRLLVTGRRKQEIENSMHSNGTNIITLDNAFVDADIRRYVRECLMRDPKLMSKPARIKQQIEDVLAQKAKGMLVEFISIL